MMIKKFKCYICSTNFNDTNCHVELILAAWEILSTSEPMLVYAGSVLRIVLSLKTTLEKRLLLSLILQNEKKLHKGKLTSNVSYSRM